MSTSDNPSLTLEQVNAQVQELTRLVANLSDLMRANARPSQPEAQDHSHQEHSHIRPARGDASENPNMVLGENDIVINSNPTPQPTVESAETRALREKVEKLESALKNVKGVEVQVARHRRNVLLP